jgi:hypothetical protein
MTKKIYILLQNGYSVSYTEEGEIKCFVNDSEYKKQDGDTRAGKDIAESLKNKLYDTIFKKWFLPQSR